MDHSGYKPPTKHAKINFAIIRCLRDTGDGDYVAARLAARHRLVPQFLWSAEQALEKYLKGMALHGVSVLNIGHDILKALTLIEEKGGLKEQVQQSVNFLSLLSETIPLPKHRYQWASDRTELT